jgi:hypothetical protein
MECVGRYFCPIITPDICKNQKICKQNAELELKPICSAAPCSLQKNALQGFATFLH